MNLINLISINFVILFLQFVGSEVVDVPMPLLPPNIKESSRGFTHFLNLWEYSLKTDQKVSQREDLDPKTLLLPGDSSMAHLVPQDGFHPLYGGSKYAKMRQEFILDHLVLESIPVEGADEGIRGTTLSGKEVFIKRDTAGEITVNDIKVHKTISLDNTYFIYILRAPLFNQTMKVRQAFHDMHKIPQDDPVGPPLDIPEGPFPPAIPEGPSVIRAPAPPQRIAKPPAPLQGHINLPTADSSSKDVLSVK